jgi:hypothetical protein
MPKIAKNGKCGAFIDLPSAATIKRKALILKHL